MSDWFYLFLVFGLLGFLMLLAAAIWAYKWSQGQASTSSENVPAGMWVLFAIGTFFFLIGMIGMLYFVPYADWYNY